MTGEPPRRTDARPETEGNVDAPDDADPIRRRQRRLAAAVALGAPVLAAAVTLTYAALLRGSVPGPLGGRIYGAICVANGLAAVCASVTGPVCTGRRGERAWLAVGWAAWAAWAYFVTLGFYHANWIAVRR